MKIIKTVALLLVFSQSFSQGFLIYDNNDYIKPSWLDPEKMGMDSVKSMHYLATFVGTGFAYSFVAADSTNPEVFQNNYFFSTTFFSKIFQLNLKCNYKAGGFYKSSIDGYKLSHDITPKVQLGFYPLIFSKSYLKDQLRLQATWSPAFDLNENTKGAVFDKTLFQFDFGGFVTNSKWNHYSPPLALQFRLTEIFNKTAPDVINYSLTAYSSLLSFNVHGLKNTLYPFIDYSRQIKNGTDRSNAFGLGLINELYLSPESASAFYLFADYNFDYLYSGSNGTEGNSIPAKKIIQVGLFFNFSVYGHMFYNYN